jgi:septal ring factor EnvC (AmiA/AmiB activator)
VNTPTPSRFKDIDVSGNESDLVRDIFAVLQEANIMLTDQAQKSLTSVLSKHATHAKSVTKGRDVLRASIKAKDAKIAEMTYRVNTLEAELEAEKAVVKHLQWKAESGLSPD